MQTVEEAHQRDRIIEILRRDVKDHLLRMRKEDLVDLLVNVAEVVDSCAATLVSMPSDLSTNNPHVSWLYGIFLGWDDVAGSIASRHGWQEYTTRRMLRYNTTVERLIK